MLQKKLRKKHKGARILIVGGILAIIFIVVFIVDVFVLPFEYVLAKISLPQVDERNDDEMKIYFVDVGQGDCTIIQFPDDTNMIIDGGNTTSETLTQVLRYVNALKIKKFDYLLLTHPDSDHNGALDDVINYCDIGEIFMPYCINSNINLGYKEFVKRAYSCGAEINYSEMNDYVFTKDIDKYFYMLFLSPYSVDTPGGQYEKLNKANPSSLEKNDVSAVCYLSYADTSCLFMGDASANIEAQLLNTQQATVFDDSLFTTNVTYDNKNYKITADIKDIDIFKVPHHGSTSSSRVEFINYVSPETSVISVGKNSYSHPSQKVVSRLYDVNSSIYRTDECGTVTITITPKGYFVEYQNQGSTFEELKNDLKFFKQNCSYAYLEVKKGKAYS